MPNECYLYSSALRRHVLSRLAHRQQTCDEQSSEGESVLLNTPFSLTTDSVALKWGELPHKAVRSCGMPCSMTSQSVAVSVVF